MRAQEVKRLLDRRLRCSHLGCAARRPGQQHPGLFQQDGQQRRHVGAAPGQRGQLELETFPDVGRGDSGWPDRAYRSENPGYPGGRHPQLEGDGLDGAAQQPALVEIGKQVGGQPSVATRQAGGHIGQQGGGRWFRRSRQVIGEGRRPGAGRYQRHGGRIGTIPGQRGVPGQFPVNRGAQLGARQLEQAREDHLMRQHMHGWPGKGFERQRRIHRPPKGA